jgi:hypothetical protein
MSDHHTHIELVDVDDIWLQEWAARGIVAIERYLARHAAFAEYLRRHPDLDSADGDRRQDA